MKKLILILLAAEILAERGYRRIGAFLPPEQEADEIMYLKTLE